MTKVPIFTVEAFNVGENEAYTGNPAAVCILEYDDDIPDEQKQKIAQTMNLSETAFVSKEWKRSEPKLQQGSTDPTVLKRTLRWFTPAREVPLCGHATVASARAILAMDEGGSVERIEFESLCRGLLTASIDRSKELIILNFPANPTNKIPLESNWLPHLTKMTLGPAFNVDDPLSDLEDVQYSEREKILVLRLKRRTGEAAEETIKKVKPYFQRLLEATTGELSVDCHIVTIEGDKNNINEDTKRPNFYSRFFGSLYGIDEDPVTGLAHTILTNYWTKEFNFEGKILVARQTSARGGDLSCRLEGDRVRIGGRARVVLQGQLHL